MSVELAPLRLAALTALLSLLPGGQAVRVSEFAVPKAVVAGESVELQCRYELDSAESESQVVVKWWRTPLDGSPDQSKQLYQRIGGMPPQLVQPNLTSKGQDSISLPELLPEDSGVYECEVASMLGEARQHQALRVYTQGSGPSVNASLEADGARADGERDVLVTCEAYDVAPEPDLAITVDKKPLESQQWVSAPESGLYNVTANVTLSRARAEGAEIRCELFFRDETISHPVFDDVILYQEQGAVTTTEEPLGTSEAVPDAVQVTDPGTLQDNAAGHLGALPAVVGLTVLAILRSCC